MFKLAIGVLIGAGLGWYYESRITDAVENFNKKTGLLES